MLGGFEEHTEETNAIHVLHGIANDADIVSES